MIRKSLTDPHCGLAIGLLEIGVIYVDGDAELNELKLPSQRFSYQRQERREAH